MQRIIPPMNFINFMNPVDQSTQQILSQIGFTFCPTFSTIPFILNSGINWTQTGAFSQDPSKIDEQELRLKLLEIFRKDKQKYQSICDKFMDVMELEKMCQTIRALSDFIHKTVSQDCKSIFDHKKKPQNISSSQSTSYNSLPANKSPLSIFSTQASFLSTIFSRDKIQVILSVHTSYQKVLNFLNFLNVSLQSFNFTNEKEWILMKDEIQRYLMKYERNVEKVLQVKGAEMRNRDVGKEKQNVERNQQQEGQKKQKSTQGHPQIYGSSQLNTRLQQQLNLKQYKRDIILIRQKIKQLQITMCTAVRNSFLTWYQKFQTIVENLKSQLGYICKLLEKTKKFQNSMEKYQIVDFLLVTRAKGLEVVVFLQQIFKGVLGRLEKERVGLRESVVNGRGCKMMEGRSQERKEFGEKEQGMAKSVGKIFRKIEQMLGINLENQAAVSFDPISANEDSEVDSLLKNYKNNNEKSLTNNEKGKNNKDVNEKKRRKHSRDQEDEDWSNEKPSSSGNNKKKKIRKERKQGKDEKRKMEMNIILKSPEKKEMYMQMEHEVVGNNQKENHQQKNQEQKEYNSPIHQRYPQKMSPQQQQPSSPSSQQSSSLQFLISQQLPYKPHRKTSENKSLDNLIFQQIPKKNLWPSVEEVKSSDDIEPLSIEEQIELDFDSFKRMDSDELVMMEKGFNEEEIRRMENDGGSMMGE